MSQTSTAHSACVRCGIELLCGGMWVNGIGPYCPSCTPKTQPASTSETVIIPKDGFNEIMKQLLEINAKLNILLRKGKLPIRVPIEGFGHIDL